MRKTQAQQQRDRARCLAIADALKRAAGVKVHKPCRRLGIRGCAYGSTIEAPRGINPAQLQTLAHECGHVALGHGRYTGSNERQAIEWARKMLAQHRVPLHQRQHVSDRLTAHRLDMGQRKRARQAAP